MKLSRNHKYSPVIVNAKPQVRAYTLPVFGHTKHWSYRNSEPATTYACVRITWAQHLARVRVHCKDLGLMNPKTHLHASLAYTDLYTPSGAPHLYTHSQLSPYFSGVSLLNGDSKTVYSVSWWRLLYCRLLEVEVGLPIYSLIAYICWSSRMTALILPCHSTIPCTYEGVINASIICPFHLYFSVLMYR